MTAGVLSRRRALLACALAPGLGLALLGPARAAKPPTPAGSAPAASAAASAPSAPAAAASAAAPRAGKPPAALLTVRVTGSDGKPVAQADVRFKFASGADLDSRTNELGIAQVEPPVDGLTKVRVVAVGWDSAHAELSFKRGRPSSLSIQLTRQDDSR